MPLLLIALLLVCSPSYAEVNDKQAILAIIGETENQGYEGMLAVAEAIRNKGNLRKVFGATNERVTKRLYSEAIYNMAERAWQDSKTSNTIGKADVWGNKSDILIFSRQKWFKSYKLVKKIKDHYFYVRV